MSQWTEKSLGLITCKNDLQLVIEDLMLAKVILGDFGGKGYTSRICLALSY